MHASCRGEKVKSGGLTVAPNSNSSLTHSRLPAAQASHSGVLPSMLRASTCFKYWNWLDLNFCKDNSNPCDPMAPPHLCTSIQQQSDTLGLSLYTRLMQRGDGVHSHNVNWSPCFNQLLQLMGSALCSGLMHCRPVCPESKTMSYKYIKPNKEWDFLYISFKFSGSSMCWLMINKSLSASLSFQWISFFFHLNSKVG